MLENAPHYSLQPRADYPSYLPHRPSATGRVLAFALTSLAVLHVDLNLKCRVS
jgi:hypothetical protein